MDVDLSFRPGEGLPVSAYAGLRTQGPIFWSDALGGWVVWSYDDVKNVLANTPKFSSEHLPIAEIFGPEAMLTTDTALHHKMRGVWEKQVSLTTMESRSEEVRQILMRSFEPMKQRLRAGATEDITDVFEDFTADAITWLMGMPAERADALKRWNRLLSDSPALGMKKGTPAYDKHMATRAEVYDFLHAEMDDRRKRLRAGEHLGDMVALMVAAEDPEGITAARVADNLLNFFLGAIDTTSKWIGNVIAVLYGQPKALEEVRADRRLLAPAIEEVMRLETVPQVLPRLVRNDGTEIAGKTLKAQEFVFVLPGIANRDPKIFRDPETLNIHRQPNPHVGFGIGMHHCLGRNIARIETIVFMNELLDSFPALEIVDCDYGSNWAVWGPVGLTIRGNR